VPARRHPGPRHATDWHEQDGGAPMLQDSTGGVRRAAGVDGMEAEANPGPDPDSDGIGGPMSGFRVAVRI
jgi:hypothetical protein